MTPRTMSVPALATALLAAVLSTNLWAQAPSAAPAPPPESLCQLRISASPDDVEIFLNGKSLGTAPVTAENILPGRHLVVATKSGFKSARKTVEMRPGERGGVELRLEPQRGLLLIHTTPDGAAVKIDDTHRGTTPLLITDLEFGTHRLALSARGYKSMEIEVEVPDTVPVKVQQELASDSAILRLSSTPSGAKVRLGGVDKGTTPLKIDRILSGEILLEVTAKGYEDYVQKLMVRAGEDLPIHATMTPLPGQIRVESIPSKARVYVDDQFRGVTPFSMPKAKPQAYSIRVETVGYSPMTRVVRLSQAESLTEEFRLERNSGILELTTEPAGVTVFVDGKVYGTTTPGASDQVSEAFQVDLLSVGEHLMQLTKKGYFETKETFQVKRDATYTLHKKMERRFIPDTVVQTRGLPDSSYRGVLTKRYPNGDVEIEIYDGVFRNIKFANIVRILPIKTAKPDDPED